MTDCIGTICYLIQEPNLVPMEGGFRAGHGFAKNFTPTTRPPAVSIGDQRHTTRADATEWMMLPLPRGGRLLLRHQPTELPNSRQHVRHALVFSRPPCLHGDVKLSDDVLDMPPTRVVCSSTAPFAGGQLSACCEVIRSRVFLRAFFIQYKYIYLFNLESIIRKRGRLK
jgi:hypothetical protein